MADPIQLQKQIRNNSQDLQNYFQELKQWGEEMKRKDECLKAGYDPSDTGQTPIPRSSGKSQSKSEDEKPKIKSKRIRGADYSAWDKYDADAECTKVDDEDYKSGDLTDEYDENAQDEAVYEKEKGNKYVKNQKWKEAIECYTKAIKLYGYDPIFYANRALCHLKLANYRVAETDCTNALRLDKTYVKAYQRRSVAREALNQLSEAHNDLLKVFDYEPNNKESKAALAKLEKKLEAFNKQNANKPDKQRPKSKFTLFQEERKEKLQIKPVIELNEDETDSSTFSTYWPSGNEVEIVEAVYKQPHLRSKKPLRRITIVDEDEAVSKTDEKQTSWPLPSSSGSVINCDELKIVERKVNNETHNPSQPRRESKFSKERKNLALCKENDAPVFNFSVPENSVQFCTDWKLFKNKPEFRYRYLKQVNPNKLGLIFKESLDYEVFSGIIQTLADSFIQNNLPVHEYLQGVCQVKRFSMLTMFMTDEDKKGLLKLCDYMKTNNTLQEDVIAEIIKKYGI